jgi:hypothetical protein
LVFIPIEKKKKLKKVRSVSVTSVVCIEPTILIYGLWWGPLSTSLILTPFLLSPVPYFPSRSFAGRMRKLWHDMGFNLKEINRINLIKELLCKFDSFILKYDNI